MATEAHDSRLPLASGWLLWLAWTYAVVFAFGVLFTLASLVLGSNPLAALFGLPDPGPVQVTWWWLTHQVVYVGFGVGCIAILARDRDLAWFAVVFGWAVACVQCLDAFLAIFHLRLSIPLSAPFYAAVAWRTASLMRAPERQLPPGSLGTL